MTDLGAGEYTECEMCGNEKIRYVHHMEHEEYPQGLDVGTVCAGNMESDIDGSKSRMRDFKKTLSGKSKWVSKDWKISHKGNLYKIVPGGTCGVYTRGDFKCWYRDKFPLKSFGNPKEAKEFLYEIYTANLWNSLSKAPGFDG